MSERRVAIVAGLMLLTFGPASTSGGATWTFQEGVDGYSATKDTILWLDNPDTSYENYYIGIDATGSGEKSTDGLVEFDDIFGAGPGQIPLGTIISSASLTLRQLDSSFQSGATLHRMVQPWNENDTWNEWGNGIQANDTEAASVVNGTIGTLINGPQFITIDVTQSVQMWSNGTANYGWAFLAADLTQTNGVTIASSESTESSYRPKLTIVPEPATTILMMAAGIPMLLKRRKKVYVVNSSQAGDGSR